MRCTSLQRLSIVHQCFNGIGCNCTGEFITFGLSALNNWHCQRLFTEICIYVQHLFCFCKCLFCGCMNGMSLLPQEFSRTQERSCRLFPTNHAHPLIIQFRQIPIAVHDFCIVVAKQCFGSRTYTKPFFQLFRTAVCDPCNFRCKAFYMVFFLLQQAFRNEHRHANVFMSSFLERFV